MRLPWVLFLRYLDQLEQDKADEAGLEGQSYEYILDEEYRWANWAMRVVMADNTTLQGH